MRISAWHIDEGDVTIIQIEGRECVYVGSDGRIHRDFFSSFKDVDLWEGYVVPVDNEDNEDGEDERDGNYNEDDWREDR